MSKNKKQKKEKSKKLEKAEKVTDRENADLPQDNLIEQIKSSAAGLYYISETDAEISPFIGKQTESVSGEVILSQTKSAAGLPVEEIEFTKFFARLTEIQDWFGVEEKNTAEKYLLLKKILEKNLRDLKVFKIGKIQLDIYVVGLDAENRLLGIKTKAVET